MISINFFIVKLSVFIKKNSELQKKFKKINMNEKQQNIFCKKKKMLYFIPVGINSLFFIKTTILKEKFFFLLLRFFIFESKNIKCKQLINK